MKKLNKDYSIRTHVVTDMGNGGSFCNQCLYSFGGDPFIDFLICPGCKRTVVDHGIGDYL
jgi:hypothetical protein